VLSFPGRRFETKVTYVAPMIDPVTRRVSVRATIENTDMLLRPEMFASVTIFVREAETSPAVPRDAIIYEGDAARVWIATDKALALRRVKLGLVDRNMVQVLEGLDATDKVVTKGSVFIDRATSGDEAL
jgi:membrane fusion protein, heavy metal efflux system